MALGDKPVGVVLVTLGEPFGNVPRRWIKIVGWLSAWAAGAAWPAVGAVVGAANAAALPAETAMATANVTPIPKAPNRFKLMCDNSFWLARLTRASSA